MKQQPNENVALVLATEFQGRLTAALEMLTGERVEVLADAMPADDLQAPSGQGVQWKRFAFTPINLDAMWIGSPPNAELALGSRVLLAAGVEEFEDADLAASCAEVLQTAVAAVAQFVAKQLGYDVSAAMGEVDSTLPPLSALYRLRMGFVDAAIENFYLAIPARLVDSLEAPKQVPTAATDTSLPDTAEPSVAPANPLPTAPKVAVPRSGLEHILQFELPLRVSFGKANIPLREVLKLTTGSIVELDRTIADPVEIIVNDRVIGKGEVVVVDGNYGVRIQEVTHSNSP